MSRTKRATVSLCMIVRNEARNLPDCLSNVADLFDQIVIVDTGSVDETRNIARRWTTHVHDFAWCDDFAAARNESLRHATGNWIFWLDADDRLDAENAARLQRLFASLDERPAAYVLDTVCAPRDELDPPRLLSHVRLFRRHTELKFAGRVHEQLAPSPGALGFAVCPSDVRIEHLGYRDSAQVRRKLQRDLRLLRMDYAVDPHDARTLLHLGTTHAELGKRAEARSFFQQVLAAATAPHDYLRRVYSALGDLNLAAGRLTEAIAILQRGRSVFPDDEYLAYLQAEAHYELDDYETAQRLLVEIVNAPPARHYHAGGLDNIQGQVAPRSLGEVLRIQRQFTAAQRVLQTVVERYPDDAIAWHALGRIYIDLRDRERLDYVRGRLANCPRGRLLSPLLLAAWRLLHGEWKAAERLLDDLIAQAPQMPLLRLMRAELVSRRGAGLTECLQAYRDVLRVSPGNAAAAAMVQQLEGSLHRPATVAALNLCTPAAITGASMFPPARVSTEY